uniref:Uncharacterized protein n=2 Tax=Zea mays TaxID=4577 RepID=A0A804RCD1_MAIZE
RKLFPNHLAACLETLSKPCNLSSAVCHPPRSTTHTNGRLQRRPGSAPRLLEAATPPRRTPPALPGRPPNTHVPRPRPRRPRPSRPPPRGARVRGGRPPAPEAALRRPLPPLLLLPGGVWWRRGVPRCCRPGSSASRRCSGTRWPGRWWPAASITSSTFTTRCSSSGSCSPGSPTRRPPSSRLSARYSLSSSSTPSPARPPRFPRSCQAARQRRSITRGLLSHPARRRMRRRSARGNGCGECGHRSHRETMVITRTREPVDVFLKSSVPCCYQAGDHASHQTLEVCTALCRTCML